MATLQPGAFASKDFVFLIGEDQTPFHAHSEIIAQQSLALNVLINGSMSEAKSGTAILKEVTKETFECFCQFAYTGDYATPLHYNVESSKETNEGSTSSSTSREQSRSVTHFKIAERYQFEPLKEEKVVEEPVENDDWRSFGVATKQTRKRRGWPEEAQQPPKSSINNSNNFDALTLKYKVDETNLKSPCHIKPNVGDTQDFTPVLLGHSRVYVFADQYGISNLKKLALSKLHLTLTTFTLYESRRADVVALLRYAFDNAHTGDRGVSGDDSKIDDLRELVLAYASVVGDSLIQCADFIELVGEGGEFAQDFVQNLIARSN